MIRNLKKATQNHTILHFSALLVNGFGRLTILLNTYIVEWETVMPLEDYNMERITHVRVDDRDFNLYISVCYDTMRLHAWKYDESSIEWESFTSLTEFSDWIQKPIKRVDKKRLR